MIPRRRTAVRQRPRVVSVFDGIKAALPHANVSYAQGCDANCTSETGFGAATAAARAADATVVVVGEPAADTEGFQRISVSPSQSKPVTFTLNASNLGYYDNNGRFRLTPGPVDVWVGDSSVDNRLPPATFTL